MQSDSQTGAGSKVMVWIGRVISALVTLFMLFAGAMNVTKPESVVEQTVKMGYPESAILPLGIVVIVSALLYALPPTAVLGAILLTGYLGGAVATHLIHGDPLPMVFFPVIFGVLVWGGLYLRDAQLRALVPVRR